MRVTATAFYRPGSGWSNCRRNGESDRGKPVGILLFTAALLSGCFAHQGMAETTRVAVASSFSKPMRAIVEQFEENSGHTVQLSFGPPGKLFTQIQRGVPYDAFLSEDAGKPARLLALGAGVPDSTFTYAVGRLALWGGVTQDAKKLLDFDMYDQLAIANPRAAPYGKAAMQVLRHLQQQDSVRLITAGNISEAFRTVADGKAEIGFVALAQIVRDGEIPAGAWLVPQAFYDPIYQDAVLLQQGNANPATLSLLAFLRSDSARAIIRSYGYEIRQDDDGVPATDVRSPN